MSYVVYTKDRQGNDGYYWAGGFRVSGRPNITDKLERALLFHSAEAAYEEAGKHRILSKWRVGKRVGA